MFNLKLTEQELNLLAGALSQLPYAKVAELLENIKEQVAKEQESKKQED